VLHGYSYVPGVTVSGQLTGSRVALTVGGSAAAHGGLHSGPGRSLVGTLGGEHVRLVPEAASSRANGIAGPEASVRTPPPLLALGEALAQLPDGSSAVADMRYLLAHRGISASSTPR
jgi:hypothetical protein